MGGGVGSEHEWIKDANQAPDTPLGTEVLTRLRNFETMNQLKKKALRVGIRSWGEGKLGSWGIGELGG